MKWYDIIRSWLILAYIYTVAFFGLPRTFHSLNAFHFRTSNAHDFLIYKRKHQVWACIFLERDEYLSTKISWVWLIDCIDSWSLPFFIFYFAIFVLLFFSFSALFIQWLRYCTRENSDFSTHTMKYIWYSPNKSKYPLYHMDMDFTHCQKAGRMLYTHKNSHLEYLSFNKKNTSSFIHIYQFHSLSFSMTFLYF